MHWHPLQNEMKGTKGEENSAWKHAQNSANTFFSANGLSGREKLAIGTPE